MSATVAAPTELAIHHVEGDRRMGFFTDTTVCIGCKACESPVSSERPARGRSQFKKGGSYDHTGELSASTWRHVRFVELLEPQQERRVHAAEALAAPGEIDVAQAVADMDRWIFMSDVCKHCTNAGCLDACPTGR